MDNRTSKEDIMPAEDYSLDVWDYLGDMPYVPSRADRDALVEAARDNPDMEKRVRIWDYFFRMLRGDVGMPQQLEIEDLERQKEEAAAERQRALENMNRHIQEKKDEVEGPHRKNVQSLEKKIAKAESDRGSRRRRGWILTVLGGILCILYLILSQDSSDDFLIVFLVLGIPILLIGLQRLLSQVSDKPIQELRDMLRAAEEEHRKNIKEIEEERQRIHSSIEEEHKKTVDRLDGEIEKLRQQLKELRGQIPDPPGDDEVHGWLQEDIAWLTGQASERSGLLARLIELKDAPNPLCILGPAELQEDERIPLPFTKYPDREKHLKARRFAVLSDGTFEDFHGVYNMEFILVAEDMLGTYGCFFDFITGRPIGERTTEQYYHDVVAIATRREYREVEIGRHHTVPVEDAPTFSMSLSSGERREVTFASQSYFDGIRKQMGEEVLPQFDPERWARNPELAAENAIRALRARLRAHKGAPEQS
jgi:Flp pilus assembly protein TadB